MVKEVKYMESTILTLFQQLPELNQGQRFILGIDGLSRSGKTTFTKKMEEILQKKNISFYIFHIDEFIVDRVKRYNTGNEEWVEYYHLQWNVRWLKDHFFTKLRESEELTLPLYDSSTNKQNWQLISIPPASLIIIEGIFLQRKEWRKYFDYMMYLDSSREIRFNRESNTTKRNIDKFKNRYWKAEEYYLKTINPKALADVVIKNE